MTVERRSPRGSVALSVVPILAVALLAGSLPVSAASDESTPRAEWAGVLEKVGVSLETDGSVVGTPSQLTRIVAQGTGPAQIEVPMSESGLTVLDPPEGETPPVVDGEAQISLDLDGTEKLALKSDFTDPLPVEVEVSYELDGEAIDPSELAGKAGRVKVTITLTNVTEEEEVTVSFIGFDGVPQEKTLSVTQPFFAVLAASVPVDATRISASEGALVWPSSDGVDLTWRPVLADGTPQTFSYEIHMDDASVGPTSILVHPHKFLKTPEGKEATTSAQSAGSTGAKIEDSLTAAEAELVKLQDLQASGAANTTHDHDMAIGRKAAKVKSGVATARALSATLSAQGPRDRHVAPSSCQPARQSSKGERRIRCPRPFRIWHGPRPFARGAASWQTFSRRCRRR